MATIDVFNPSTAETIDSVPSMTADEVDDVVEKAKRALPEWLDATPGERAALLLKLADVIDENAEELAQIESRNVGKPLMASRDEMPFCADNLRFFAGAARNLEGKSAGEYIKGYTSMIRREPIGIVAGICPWNYPLMMAIWKLGPAISAGNVQILKPSEQTPMSLLRFMELAKDVIPEGVLQVVTGDGVPTGQRLVDHPDIGLVSLTGDIATGKLIARNAADTLKRVHLELGGKAPMVVFDDADPRAGRRGHQDRRLLELGPGLHRRVTDHRRPEDLRRAARGPRPDRRGHQGRRSGHERRHRDGAGDHEGPAGPHSRVPRSSEGRHRPHRGRSGR